MKNLIKITNSGPGILVLGEDFPESKPLAKLRIGQSTIIRLGTPIRSEGTESKIKVEDLDE